MIVPIRASFANVHLISQDFAPDITQHKTLNSDVFEPESYLVANGSSKYPRGSCSKLGCVHGLLRKQVRFTDKPRLTVNRFNKFLVFFAGSNRDRRAVDDNAAANMRGLGRAESLRRENVFFQR